LSLAEVFKPSGVIVRVSQWNLQNYRFGSLRREVRWPSGFVGSSMPEVTRCTTHNTGSGISRD